MTPLILLLALAAVSIGGLAWVTVPLVRNHASTPKRRPSPDNDNLTRALDLLDDLDAEFDRGKISRLEHAELVAELQHQAALALDTLRRHRQEATLLVDDLVANRIAATKPDPPNTSEPGTAQRTTPWLVAAGILVVALVAVVVVITVGARRGLSEQTTIGNVGATGIVAAATSPTDASVLAVAHASGINISQDGGTSWQPTEFPHAARWLTATVNGFIAISDGTLFQGDVSGVNWNSTTPAPEFHYAAAGRHSNWLVGISANGSIYTSDNEGSKWDRLTLTAPPTVTALAVVDGPEPLILAGTSTEGVLVAAPSGTWRSGNGFVNGALPTVHIRDLHYEPDSGDRYESPAGQTFEGAIYAATDVGLFKTVDGMQTWIRMSLLGDVVAISSGASDPRRIYAVSRDGSIFRSHDAGVSWK